MLNQAVKRNIERFPDDFMFELTQQEYNFLRSQIVILKESEEAKGRGKHSKYLPFVFTEHGVSMLASVLRGNIAVNVSIQIVRAFVAMRHLVLSPPVNNMVELRKEVHELKQYVEKVFEDYNDINEDTRVQLELINETLAQL